MSAGISFGYGGGLAKQDFVFQNRTRSTTNDTREVVKYSLGSGLQINGSFGYSFNENVGAELGVSYLIGSKTTAVDKDTRDPASITTETYTVKANALNFAPGIVFKVSSGKTVQPYIKLNGIISIPTVTQEGLFEDTAGPWQWKETWEAKKGTALGFGSALGANYSLGNIVLFGELYVSSLSYSPKNAEMTEASQTDNGTTTNELPNLDVIDKQITYVDSYDRNTVNNDVTKPRQELKMYLPFSNCGLRIGVRFNF